MNTLNPADTPLLLIAWRRPQTLRLVIDAIRPIAPKWIFVACDGPNPSRPGEVEKVAATRALINQEIDWPCNIQRLYSQVNQGCRLGVSRSINWFFDQVEMGIVLEDDCVPHPDFIPYCTDLLQRYRDDERVFLITGHNKEGVTNSPCDYFFSRLGGIWGWASWRRAWRLNTATLLTLEVARQRQILEDLIPPPIAVERYSRCHDILSGRLDTWDYEWGYCRLINSGLACVPRFNMISNIGGGADSTHTSGLLADDLSEERFNFPLQEPLFLVPSSSYDALYVSSTPGHIRRIKNKMLSLIRVMCRDKLR